MKRKHKFLDHLALIGDATVKLLGRVFFVSGCLRVSKEFPVRSRFSEFIVVRAPESKLTEK